MRRAWVAVVWASALAASGCVEDADEAGGEQPVTRIEVAASEFRFDPDRWTIPAGEAVDVELRNEGSVAHEWVVLRQGEEIAGEAELSPDLVLFEVEAVDPDSAAEASLTVDEAGVHQVICGVAGHFDAGMEGQLTVR